MFDRRLLYCNSSAMAVGTLGYKFCRFWNTYSGRAVTELPVPLQPCFTCQSTSHQGEHCPISHLVRDLMVEMQMLWAKIGHWMMHSMETPTIPTGRTTPTSLGILNLQHMFPQVHSSSNSMGPPLSSSNCHPLP